MRFWKKLKKLWYYFKYYIYRPYWKWIFFPSYKVWRKVKKPLSRVRMFMSDLFWRFVSAVERSPEYVRGTSRRTFKFLLGKLFSLKIVLLIGSWLRSFFKVYFRFVNFRRLLLVYIAADFFYFRWSDEGINKDLRIWNICMLLIFFKVLYMLMDGADGKVRLFSHDFITRAYFKYYLGVVPGEILSDEQMKDSFLKRYIVLRHRRNIYICTFGFLYTGQPLFRS